MKYKKIILLMAMTLPVVSYSQSNSNLDLSVETVAGCYLSAKDINFGVLVVPLIDHITSSSMEIKCSMGASYTVDLSYGGVYGSGVGGGGGKSYSMLYNGTNEADYADKGGLSSYRFFDPDVPSYINFVDCYGNGSYQVSSNSKKYGVNKCVLNDEGKYVPLGWSVSWNNKTRQYFNQGTGYNYGLLTGIKSGEQIKYYVVVPNSTKVWNLGVEKYSSVGNGEVQIIPMKTKIDRADNPTHRLSADTYQDIMSVILTY